MLEKVRKFFRHRKEIHEREKALKARREELDEKQEVATKWFQEKMSVQEPADDKYEKEVLPRLTPVHFLVDNRELNQAIDPWVSANEKWFSKKKA